MFNQIKWAYQRLTRGYDDRVYWGFYSYFIQVIPALEKFCNKYLEDKEHCELNTSRADIFRNTLLLIEKYKEKEDDCLNHDEEELLFEYVGKHLGWYWD